MSQCFVYLNHKFKFSSILLQLNRFTEVIVRCVTTRLHMCWCIVIIINCTIENNDLYLYQYIILYYTSVNRHIGSNFR